MNTGLVLSLKQKLSQSQILFLQLLPMTNQELDKFLEEESMENPLLEKDESSVISFRADYADGLGRKNYISSNNELDILLNLPQPAVTDIRSFFTEQLDRKKYTDKQWGFVNICIKHLDERGYLDRSLFEQAEFCKYDKDFRDEIIFDLKQLEPAGCFAEDLSECLSIQLDRKGNRDRKLRMIIKDHLDDVLKQRISYIAKMADISTQQARKYITLIAELDPKPLSGFQPGQDAFVIPDIVCIKENREWKIELNTGFFDGYCLSDYYCSMMQSTDDEELKSYFNVKMNRVKMIMENIEQRRSMMIKLMSLLIERQNDFFERKGNIRPFTMAEAAEILEVNPSTVTRTVKNKWIQYPGGTVSMKSLFTSAVSYQTDCSSHHIKEILAGLVKQEKPEEPYSDFQLMEMLEAEGVKISRRTVAKYRAEMGIQSCYDRRKYA